MFNFFGKPTKYDYVLDIPKRKEFTQDTAKPRVLHSGYSVGIDPQGNTIVILEKDGTKITLTLGKSELKKFIRLLQSTLEEPNDQL